MGTKAEVGLQTSSSWQGWPPMQHEADLRFRVQGLTNTGEAIGRVQYAEHHGSSPEVNPNN